MHFSLCKDRKVHCQSLIATRNVKNLHVVSIVVSLEKFIMHLFIISSPYLRSSQIYERKCEIDQPK